MKIYNCHSHFGVEIGEKINFKTLFDYSYVGWQNKLKSENKEDIKDYFEKNMTMRAFIQLKLAIEKLYGEGLLLNEDTWDIFNQRIIEKYKEKGYQNHVLRDICHYEDIIIDDYIDIRNDGSNGVKCKVALRCDFLFYGYSKESLLSCEAKPFDFYENVPDNINDYIIKMREYITESIKMNKCYAIKVCMAYFRDIDFDITDKDKAKLVYNDKTNPIYIKYFQDYIMGKICEIAGEYNIPVQIHTGFGQINKTSAIYLLRLIRKYTNVNFVLLHGSFPWTDDLLAILYDCPNTYLDICWMPLLSLTISKSTLISVLELIGCDRIVWGCDTATVEESYGALLATIALLDEVVDYFIKNNVLDQSQANILKEKILYNNAKSLFK